MKVINSCRYYLSKLVKKLHFSAIRNSEIHLTSKVEAGSEIYNSRIEKHSFCGYHCKISECDIGSFCSIADNVSIGGGMHPVEWISTSPAFYAGRDSIRAKFSEHAREKPKRVSIGHDVWIGERVLIKQGVSIGTGSVVGMGSVVTKDVPPYTIVAGVPATVIRKRFEDQNLVDRLLKSKWWEMDESLLSEAAIHARDPVAFLDKIGS